MSSDHVIYRKDYQPYPFEVEQVALQIDLYEEEALVEATLRMRRLLPGALHLLGDELELLSIAIDGRELSPSAYQQQGSDLVLPTVPEQFTLVIKTKIFPAKNTQLTGLYKTNHLFCTQCEAHGFRRITYFPDRPDVLSRYTTTISADKAQYPVLLSNGNLLAQGEDDSTGRHWVEWSDPFKKPSYLFALVAGTLDCLHDTFVTQSGRPIDLRLYVEPGQLDKCAHAMASLKHAMRWDEEVYGREYDLDCFMIVAVSDFNMGAMENKGLNIFNSACVLASPSTASDGDYEVIESVVAHEYFHNWTGNRVTCRDWFQLSLKEGLTVFRDQEFSRDRYARDVKRIDDVHALRSAQFPEDAGPLAHPVRPESYEEVNNFYTATVYEKGAEVIRMQHTLLGAAGFRRGMDLYFERHDGQAVTIDDFVAAMEDANQVDWTQFKRWYSQAGTPVVQVNREALATGGLRLTLRQSCRPTPESATKAPFYIPITIAMYRQTGEILSLPAPLLILSETEQTFDFPMVPEDAVISLLRGFSAPIKLQFEQSDAERLALLRFETDGFAKWEAAQQLALACIQKRMAALAHAADMSTPFPALLGDALVQILQDETLDRSLRALLLAPPSFDEIAADCETIDVDRIEAARKWYRQALAQVIRVPALETIKALRHSQAHDMSPQAFANRRLRHTCLGILCRAGVAEAWPDVYQQFDDAQTMSDEATAFSLLASCEQIDKRDESIERFYQKWSKDALVLEKWFAIQAMSDRPDILAHVRSLLLHPAFSLKNPNKARALIGSFARGNPKYFHALDGSGYAFLTEMVLAADQLNPQLSARMVLPFAQFQRFEPQRRSLMRAQLQHISTQTISKNLREMVMKSLDAA